MSTTQLPPDATLVGDAFGRVLTSVRRDLAGLVDTQAWTLDDDLLLARFSEAAAVKAAAEELMARFAGEARDRDLPKRHGASSLRSLLMSQQRMSHGEASKVVAAAKQLHGPSAITEPVRRAQAEGQVSAEQAVLIAEAINRLDPTIDLAAVEAAQQTLLDQAKLLGHQQLRQAANHLVEVVDPDAADRVLETQLRREEARALAGTELSFQILPDGTPNGRWKSLPALQTAMLKKALEAFTSPRRNGSAAEPVETRSDGRRVE